MEARNVAVAVVTFDSDFMAKTYVKQTRLPWPLLMDHDHQLYDTYALSRGSWWGIYNPVSIWGYVKLILKGSGLHKPGSDFRQLGGDVLIDPEGIVRLHYASSTPLDRPDIQTLLAATQPD